MITAMAITTMIDEQEVPREPRRKAKLTFRELLVNSEKVYGRAHFQDRDVKIRKISPYVGTKWVRLDARSTGAESKAYDLVMVFFNVDFSDTKDGNHPVEVPVIQKGGPKIYKYMEVLDVEKHPVAVFCACTSFRFVCEWYLKEANSLAAARKARPYTRKTQSRPSVNPLRLPCVCKHLYMYSLELRTRGFLR